jgi:hypothetical protein
MKSTLRALALVAIAAGLALASSVAVQAKTATEAIASAVKATGHAAHKAVFGYMASLGMVLFATTQTDIYTGRKPRRNTPFAAEPLRMVVPFDLPAANPTVNDLIALCKVPAGVKIADWYIQMGDADSNGTPTLEFSLGSLNAAQDDLTTVYAATIAVGETGALSRAATSVAYLEASTAERVVGIKWSTAAATYVAGKTGLLVLELLG